MLLLSAQQCDSAPSLPSWLGWSVSALLLASPLAVAQTAERGNTVGVAAASLGSGDGAVLSLVRELTEWRNRALDAESRLAEAGFQATSAAKQRWFLARFCVPFPKSGFFWLALGVLTEHCQVHCW